MALTGPVAGGEDLLVPIVQALQLVQGQVFAGLHASKDTELELDLLALIGEINAVDFTAGLLFGARGPGLRVDHGLFGEIEHRLVAVNLFLTEKVASYIQSVGVWSVKLYRGEAYTSGLVRRRRSGPQQFDRRFCGYAEGYRTAAAVGGC